MKHLKSIYMLILVLVTVYALSITDTVKVEAAVPTPPPIKLGPKPSSFEPMPSAVNDEADGGFCDYYINPEGSVVSYCKLSSALGGDTNQAGVGINCFVQIQDIVNFIYNLNYPSVFTYKLNSGMVLNNGMLNSYLIYVYQRSPEQARINMKYYCGHALI